jgi:hypothetical protein
MSAHVDVEVVVPAPLDAVWRISNEHERWEAQRHRSLVADADGLRFSFQVTSPPDPEGRTWTYWVERCLYHPAEHVVHARRWGNPEFRYSVAWWLYDAVEGGTRVRSVQDFEMADGASADDLEMQRIITDGTRKALERMAARVMSALAEADTEPAPASSHPD